MTGSRKNKIIINRYTFRKVWGKVDFIYECGLQKAEM